MFFCHSFDQFRNNFTYNNISTMPFHAVLNKINTAKNWFILAIISLIVLICYDFLVIQKKTQREDLTNWYLLDITFVIITGLALRLASFANKQDTISES